MEFTELQSGQEVTIRVYGQLNCRAKITGRRDGQVTGFLWNSVAGRWNRNPVVIKPDRVVKYPDQE